MFSKRMLYLSGSHLLAAVFRRGRLTDQREFSLDELGQKSFAEFLAATEGSLFLVVDILEEDFRIDEIAHVRGRNHDLLVERRQNQLYRVTPYRYAAILDRKIQGNKDRMLFTAITNPERLKPWRDAMNAAKAPMAGIWSTAFLSEKLWAKLKIADLPETFVMVTRQQSGGLRQSFFSKGRLLFSRLTMPTGLDMAESLIEESGRVQQYLANARLLPRDQPMRVIYLGHAEEVAGLVEGVKADSSREYRFLRTEDMLHVLKIGHLPEGVGVEFFMLAFLAVNPSSNLYGTRADLWYWHLAMSQLGMKSLGVAVLVSAMVGAGLGLSEVPQILSGTRESDLLAAKYRQRAENIRATLPEIAISGQEMQEAVEINRAIDGLPTGPDTMILTISHALDQVPEVRVRGFSWTVALTADTAAPPLELAGEAEISDVASEMDASVDQGAQGEAAPAGQSYYEIAKFAGEIRPFRGYPDALGKMNAFVKALQANPAWQVTVRQAPVDVSAKGLIQGVVGSDDVAPTANFILRIVHTFSQPTTPEAGEAAQ